MSVSSMECIQALITAGYRRSRGPEGTTVLTRGYRLVVVPDMPVLAPEALSSILGDAGIALPDFVELVGQAPTTQLPRLVR